MRRFPLDVPPADAAAVEAIVRAAGTSFYRGMRILERDRRLAMYGVYAFCRIVDDIADEPGPLASKISRLDAWRSRIEGVMQGRSDGPVTRVLAAAAAKYGLRKTDFLAVIDGMQMDAGEPVMAPDLATLDLYCDRVAAAVGRLSVRAFGDSSAAADRVAHALGRALQLTNILRDVHEDAGLGRLYLPREWLHEAGVPLDPALAAAHPALPRVTARAAALAHEQFSLAHAAMAECDPRAMRPARLMGATYAALLARVEAAGGAPGRVSLPKWQKLWIAVRHGLL
jgi:phytoene synthase